MKLHSTHSRSFLLLATLLLSSAGLASAQEREARDEAAADAAATGGGAAQTPGAETLPYLDDLPPLIDREVFFGNPEISGGQISPDGKFISFVKPLDDVRNVWVKGIDEPFEAARPMTADTARPVTGYFWSEDGRYLLFVQDRGGNENFHVYAVDPAAEPAPGSRVPEPRDLTPYEGVRAVIYAVPEGDPAHILVGLNDRDPALHDVYRVNIETGERELVIQNDAGVAAWVADLEGELQLGVRQTEEGGWEILRVDGQELTPVYTCSALETCGPIRFHRSGERVYMVTNKGDPDLTRLVLLDPETGETEPVESDPEGEVDFGGAEFSEVTEELIATFYVGDRTRWYPKDEAFARDLERARDALPEGDIGFRSMTEDGSLMLVSVSSDVDPSSTYLYDRESGDIELLYRVQPDIPSEHMASMRPVRYTARDGLEIPAYLVVPEGVEPENLAAMVLPHGGPWARVSWGFNGFAQFLANRGYAVLLPNFRGSTGYGEAFLNAGNDEWGTGFMQHDITDGVKWMIDEGIADPERVGIIGGSYGGYATLAGVAFTPDLYAAGVSIVGPSSILTLLNSIPPYWEPIRALFAFRVGDLEDPEDVERMRAQSPLYSAEEITAPLLVIQGENDPRVHKAESDQIVIALRDLGREVEYLVAPNEGHGFRNEDNNLAMFAAIERFLAEQLGGRYQEEVSPEVSERLEVLAVNEDTLTLSPPAETAEAGPPIEAFPGAAVETGTARYEQTIETRGQSFQLTSTRTVTPTTEAGQPALLIVEEASGAMGSGVDSTWVNAATLVPLRRTIHQGPAVIDLTFEGGAVTGTMQAGPRTMPIQAQSDAAVFMAGPPLQVALAALVGAGGAAAGGGAAGTDGADGNGGADATGGAAAGGTDADGGTDSGGSAASPADMLPATIHLFDVLSGQVKAYIMEAGAPESVTTPGGSIEAVPVTVVPADGSPGAQMVWIESAAPHRVVKTTAELPAQMGGGTATAVLAGGTAGGQ